MSKKKLLLPILVVAALAVLGTMTVLGQETPDQDSAEATAPVAQDVAVPADQVILDDLIVNGSICAGFDCVNGQSFEYDTLILKENNLRILFQDTSNSASFPTNDWRIAINDSSNGGASYFRIEDVTNNVNAITVIPNGNVGIGVDNPTNRLHVNGGITVEGPVTDLSDGNAKENFAAVSGEEVLAQISQIPVTTWSYKNDDPAVRHMGPTAQDFYKAFGLGADDRHITSIDRDGVALVAIQQLTKELNAQEAEISRLEQENETLGNQYADLEARLAVLEDALTALTDQ